MSEKDKGLNEGREGQEFLKVFSKPKLMLIIVIFFILFLIAWLIIREGVMKTPQIGGKIVDAGTNKPIADARIKVDWYVGTLSSSMVYESLDVKSNKDGKFIIPSRFKIFSPLNSFNEQKILVYAHGYAYLIITRKRNGKLKIGNKGEVVNSALLPKGTVIKLKLLETEQDWNDNLGHLKELGQSDDINECEFAIKEYEIFLERFPNSQKAPAVLEDLAIIYRDSLSPCYDIETAKQIFQRIVEEYPDSKEAKAAQKAIEQIER
jgi:tetratricopeptide (TPR) repeat protein